MAFLTPPQRAGTTTSGAQTSSVMALTGDWTLPNLNTIEDELAAVQPGLLPSKVTIDGSRLATFSISAAAALQSWRATVKARGTETELDGFAPEQARLLEMLPGAEDYQSQARQQPPREGFVTAVGRGVYGTGTGTVDLLTFLGRAVSGLGGLIVRPWRIRGTSVVHHAYEVGFRAVPIVALMAFLISIVIGYQGVSQLRQFGADIYAVDLVGVSLLRELGILVTSIMVAGRSGSAFAAEIGVMKTNEEVDALQGMGLDTFEVLVLPRLLGILIALPLLTIVADAAGLVGGWVMSVSILDLSTDQFLNRIHQAIKLKTFILGELKAPFFAIIIGMIGCMRGLQVTGSADSIGRFTTRAVVDSIFMVLVLDAIFSVIYSSLGY